MKIKIQIGSGGWHDLNDVRESWINQQINRQRAAGVAVCVQVRIECDNIRMTLATPGCGASGGGGRAPNPHEREVFDLWDHFGLSNGDFTGGNLIAFLRQVDRVCV